MQTQITLGVVFYIIRSVKMSIPKCNLILSEEEKRINTSLSYVKYRSCGIFRFCYGHLMWVGTDQPDGHK